MNHNFTVEEVNLICVFAGESRSEVIEDMQSALPYIDDADMEELVHRVIKKLRSMRETEFRELKLIKTED